MTSKSGWVSHASGAKQAFSREYEKERNGIGEKTSLSLKNLNENQKSSKLELTFCWKLIGVNDERWSRGVRTRSGARIWAWRFGGFEDLGILKIWGFWSFYFTIAFAGVFIQIAIQGFSFSEILHARLFFSCLFRSYFWPLK